MNQLRRSNTGLTVLAMHEPILLIPMVGIPGLIPNMLGPPKTPETGQSRSVFSGPQNFLGRDSKWVSGLRLADWDVTVPPELVSFPKIKSCLRSGESFGGNVCEIWDYHTLEELLTLWSCFQQTQGLTALLFGDAKQKAQGACHARLSLTRGSFGHKLEDPGLLKIGEGRGPWLPGEQKS